MDRRGLRNSLPSPTASPIVNDRPTDAAERRSSCPVPSAISAIAPITDPPKLALGRYTEWKQSVRFWSDVHGDSPGSQLVAKLALSPDGSLGIPLTKYLHESASRSETRSLDGVLIMADNEFDRPAQEATSSAINQMMSTQRNPSANLRLFRLQFFKLQDRLVLHNAAFPSAALFSRALEALKLSSIHRSVVLTALDARTKDPSAVDLGEVSVRLFQSFGEVGNVLLETTEEETDAGSRVDSGEEQLWDECEQVVIITKGKKPPRNRPGSYSTSFRGSIGNMNVPIGFGKSKGMGKCGYGSSMGNPKGGRAIVVFDATLQTITGVSAHYHFDLSMPSRDVWKKERGERQAGTGDGHVARACFRNSTDIINR